MVAFGQFKESNAVLYDDYTILCQTFKVVKEIGKKVDFVRFSPCGQYFFRFCDVGCSR